MILLRIIFVQKMREKLMTYDALIIGGGPAGATTALLLAQAGWSVAIVEKKKFPRRKVCGEFISATSLPLLQKIGIADFYLSHAGPEVHRVGLFTADAQLFSKMPATDYSLGKWGRALGREHLDSNLLMRAIGAGAKLWQPYHVEKLQRKSGLFTCQLVSNAMTEEISARLVVMACGSWERGLEQTRVNLHTSSDLLAFKAHFRNCNLSSDLMPLLAFPGGYGGMVHTDSERVTLSCCIRRDALQNARRQYEGLQAGEAVLKYITATCRGAHQMLSSAQRIGEWLAAGPIRPGIRKRYGDGIFFVGNIAGEAHPIIAEGISMATQSAWLLSQVLIRHQKEIIVEKGIANAGTDYSKCWAEHFSNRIYVAAIFAQFAMRPWAMNIILPLFKLFPDILTFGAKMSGKIHQVIPAE
jgi:flavin-dependent dehydrogenase